MKTMQWVSIMALCLLAGLSALHARVLTVYSDASDKSLTQHWSGNWRVSFNATSSLFQVAEIDTETFKTEYTRDQYRVVDEVLVENNVVLNQPATFTAERIITTFNELILIPNLVELINTNNGLSSAVSGRADSAAISANKQSLVAIYPGALMRSISPINTSIPCPEGTSCHKTIAHTGVDWAGWGVIYPSPRNLSEYTGGELRFWINTTTSAVKIELSDTWSSYTLPSLTLLTVGEGRWTPSDSGKWKQVCMALNGRVLNPSGVTSPFKATLTAPGTCYIDMVRWVTSGTPRSGMQVRLINTDTLVQASSITFTRAMGDGVPTGWISADQCIELDVDMSTTTAWGIQIYTNNRRTNANPRYTGIANSDPSGLVRVDYSSSTLPMAWVVVDSTKTVAELGNPAPGNWANGGQWKWLSDLNTPGFVNVNYYATLWDNEGILWGTTNEHGIEQRGGADSPNYIHLSAYFTHAVAVTYRTSTLTVELFYE
jgi:hypothetical protein